MKKMVCYFLILTGFGLSSCKHDKAKTSSGGGKPDNVEMANGQNKATMEGMGKSDKDARFAVAAAEGGMLEVMLGKLAQSNAASEAVKSFGSTMVAGHTSGGKELLELCMDKYIVLPAALGNKKQDTYDKLAQKKGSDFDKAYMDLMIEDHKEDIEEFKKQASNGEDTAIKAWASGKVPVLEHHLQMAQQVKDGLK